MLARLPTRRVVVDVRRTASGSGVRPDAPVRQSAQRRRTHKHAPRCGPQSQESHDSTQAGWGDARPQLYYCNYIFVLGPQLQCLISLWQ